MAATDILADVTDHLAELLRARLEPKGEEYGAVTTKTPSHGMERARGEGQPRFNLHLFEVRPDPTWRNELPVRSDAGGEPLHSAAPQALRLRYLLSVHGWSLEEGQRALGAAMAVLHEHPVLALGEGPTKPRLTLLDLDHHALARISRGKDDWELSVAYEVSGVLLASEAPRLPPRPVEPG